MTQASRTKPVSDYAKATAAANDLPDQPTPYYDVQNGALVYVGIRQSKDTGQLEHAAPIRLCDALEIIGRGIDEGGEHSRLVHWRSRGTGEDVTLNLPCRIIGERESWALLKSKGLAVSPKRSALEHLSEYLQTHGSETIHRVTERGGWHFGAYILPGGDVVGTPSRALLYAGDTEHKAAYQPAGTAAEWTATVARLAQGNSRAMLAIGIALAAPLLDWVGMESGGFHLFGDSSLGKTTIAKVGASVWGKPSETLLGWNSTALAMANAAAARNDGLMMLDEIGQAKPDDVASTAYVVFNGVGKMQGSKEGGNRHVNRWKVLALSTGEMTLATFLATGNRKTQAGQEVRLASIKVDAGKGLGAFDTLNGCQTAGALAEALEAAAATHYGAIGRAFVVAIAPRKAEMEARLKASIEAVVKATPPDASGQSRRLASRFALVAEALEIATELGLTGWEEGDGAMGVMACFDAWIEENGFGKQEDRRIAEQAAAFFAAHGYSRFLDPWTSNPLGKEESVHNAAGYRKPTETTPVFMVFPHAFVQEIAAGFDKSKAGDVLVACGMLQGESSGRSKTKNTKIPNAGQSRLYHFVRTTPLYLEDE